LNAANKDLFSDDGVFHVNGVKILNYEQAVTSAETCRNQKAAGARLLEELFDMPQKVLDFGGGKYSEAQSYLHSLGSACEVYDPYNRTHEENVNALSQRYDVMMCNNVLNVLTDDVLHHVIDDLQKAAEVCGVKAIIVTVYERDRSGVGCYTGKNSYQRNQKTSDYMAYLGRFASVRKHKKALVIEI